MAFTSSTRDETCQRDPLGHMQRCVEEVRLLSVYKVSEVHWAGDTRVAVRVGFPAALLGIAAERLKQWSLASEQLLMVEWHCAPHLFRSATDEVKLSVGLSEGIAAPGEQIPLTKCELSAPLELCIRSYFLPSLPSSTPEPRFSLSSAIRVSSKCDCKMLTAIRALVDSEDENTAVSVIERQQQRGVAPASTNITTGSLTIDTSTPVTTSSAHSTGLGEDNSGEELISLFPHNTFIRLLVYLRRTACCLLFTCNPCDIARASCAQSSAVEAYASDNRNAKLWSRSVFHTVPGDCFSMVVEGRSTTVSVYTLPSAPAEVPVIQASLSRGAVKLDLSRFTSDLLSVYSAREPLIPCEKYYTEECRTFATMDGLLNDGKILYVTKLWGGSSVSMSAGEVNVEAVKALMRQPDCVSLLPQIVRSVHKAALERFGSLPRGGKLLKSEYTSPCKLLRAISRLVVGNEICAAAAFRPDQKQVLLTTNFSQHDIGTLSVDVSGTVLAGSTVLGRLVRRIHFTVRHTSNPNTITPISFNELVEVWNYSEQDHLLHRDYDLVDPRLQQKYGNISEATLIEIPLSSDEILQSKWIIPTDCQMAFVIQLLPTMNPTKMIKHPSRDVNIALLKQMEADGWLTEQTDVSIAAVRELEYSTNLLQRRGSMLFRLLVRVCAASLTHAAAVAKGRPGELVFMPGVSPRSVKIATNLIHETSLCGLRRQLLQSTLERQVQRWVRRRPNKRTKLIHQDVEATQYSECIRILLEEFERFQARWSTTPDRLSCGQQKYEEGLRAFLLNYVNRPHHITSHSHDVERTGAQFLSRFVERWTSCFADLYRLECWIYDGVIKMSTSLTEPSPFLNLIIEATNKPNAHGDHLFEIVGDELDTGVHAEARMLWYYRNTFQCFPRFIATSLACCGHCWRLLRSVDVVFVGVHSRLFFWPMDNKFAKDETLMRHLLGKPLHDLISFWLLEPSDQQLSLLLRTVITSLAYLDDRPITPCVPLDVPDDYHSDD